MTLKPWEFRVLLLIAIGGTVAMLFIPNVPPAAAAGIGGLTTWVFSNLKVEDKARADRRADDAR